MRRILFFLVLGLFVFAGVNLLAGKPDGPCINQFINSNSSPVHFSVNPENEHPVQMLFYGVNTDSIYLLKFNKDGSIYKQYDISALLDRYLNTWGTSYTYLNKTHAADLFVGPKDTTIAMQDVSDFYYDSPQDGIVTFKFNKYGKISRPEEYHGNHYREKINSHTSQSVKFLDENHVILYTTDCSDEPGKCKDLKTYRSRFTLDDKTQTQRSKQNAEPAGLNNAVGGDAVEEMPFDIESNVTEAIEEDPNPTLEEVTFFNDDGDLMGHRDHFVVGFGEWEFDLLDLLRRIPGGASTKLEPGEKLILARAKNRGELDELSPLTLVKAKQPEATYIERSGNNPDRYSFYSVRDLGYKIDKRELWCQTGIFDYPIDKSLTCDNKLLPQTASIGVKGGNNSWNTYSIILEQSSIELCIENNHKWKKVSISLGKHFLPSVLVKPAIAYYKSDNGKEMLFVAYATKDFGIYHFTVDLGKTAFTEVKKPYYRPFYPEKYNPSSLKSKL